MICREMMSLSEWKQMGQVVKTLMIRSFLMSKKKKIL